jgi:hypothetical protein
MRRFPWLRVAMVALLTAGVVLPLLTATGCGRRRRAEEAAPRDSLADRPRSWLDLLPKMRRDSVDVEGMPEAATSRLYRGAETHAVFWTPHPIAAEPDSARHRDVARLLWMAGPAPIRFGTVTFLDHAELPPPPAGTEPRVPKAWDWTEAEWVGLRGDHVVERFDGMHRGRGFTVELDYPIAWGDGLGPRLVLLFDSWIWVDTGRNMAEEAARQRGEAKPQPL